jgi:hypothetical protein
VQDAAIAVRARWSRAFRRRSYGLGILNELMAAALTLVALLAPSVAVPDGFG